MAESSSAATDSPKAESYWAIFCGGVADLYPAIFFGVMAVIICGAAAESSSPINDEVWSRFGREKTTHKVSGAAANVMLRGMKKIWAGVFDGDTTVLILFWLLGLICHCLVTVRRHGPAVISFMSKAFVILREINMGFAEINRCFAEIKRGFAEIKKGVAVLRRTMLGRHLRKFLIAFFLVCVCILSLYVSSPPHIRQASTPTQASTPPQASISKDLIVNITVYMRDNEGFVVRREFTCHIAIVFRQGRVFFF